jgi:hypothetical protein
MAACLILLLSTEVEMEQSSGISALLVSLAILALVADPSHGLVLLMVVGGIVIFGFTAGR